jgi:hypothetical protein
MIKDGPLKTAIEAPTDNVLKQELTSYILEDKVLVKRTVVRKFNANGDYHDYSTSEPLMEVV